ncbi:type I DNA topoisomerase [Pseudomonas sp. S4_EA_1b]|uniref:type I DNA topoisomerase n=1 Tax=Pseudomonas sp. S4_EA_1b TaxID=2796960 RepID=UPI0018E5AA9F|nr:type I DNA topoisomerase [Pseudomonas sp. S4_EA_1b]MBI6605478.1 type I DNA topoisomerase [Pseudomonas sp. S4_EA_1b]
MSKTLLIVESATKAKKIQAFLGADFVVAASVGHIRDLPKREIGVQAPDFRPQYVINDDKAQTVNRLKKLVKEAAMVYLATDLDREGEAIAWHLEQVLKPKNYKRIKFNAVTKKAIFEAIKNAGDIDYKLVAAQEGRRVLDRLIGYLVSPLLTILANSPLPLSAGRVQSTALLLVVQRERVITGFQPVDHFKLKVSFLNPAGGTWSAVWLHKPLQETFGVEKTDIFTDQATVQAIAGMVRQQPVFMVYRVEGKEKQRKPPAAFTTSTLQQAASVKLGFSVNTTMSNAQKLFDAGLITYHRTDSQNLDAEPVEEIRQWLTANGFEVPEAPHTWESKENAQEAHEAIRPTVIADKLPSELSEGTEMAKLYKLIWERAIASQMLPAVYFATQVLLLSQVKVSDQHLQFLAKGRRLLSPGWLALTEDDATEEKSEDSDDQDESDHADLPPLTENQQLTCNKVDQITSTTKPPPRFTEASLVKALEAAGVGRPSTYGAIIQTLFSKSYVGAQSRKIIALPLGCFVIDLLHGRFSFVELEFTRIIEGGLDKIAAGQTNFKTVVSYQYNILEQEVNRVKADTAALESSAAASTELFGHLVECPICKKGRLRRKGSSGSYFWGCTNYPECTATCREVKAKGKEPEPDLDTIRTKGSEDGDKPERVLSEENCPKCKKKKLALRPGARGPFWGCTGYPKCKATYEDDSGKPVLEKAQAS